MLDLSKSALLFDCDGTITDEDFLPEIVARTIESIVVRNGIEFDRAVFDQVFTSNKGGGFDKYYLGYLNAIEQTTSILNSVSMADFIEEAITKYTETVDAITRGEDVGITFNVNEDAVQIIQWANKNGIPVIIVTNADPRILAANLKMAGLGVVGETEGQTFMAYVNGTVDKSYYGENAVLRKPNPFPFEQGARIASSMDRPVSIEHCIGFEDSMNGHESMFHAKVGLRVHVCEEAPSEPVAFVRNGHHFGPDLIAPHGKLTSGLLLNAIDQLNNTGTVVSMDFMPAAKQPEQPKRPQKVPGRHPN